MSERLLRRRRWFDVAGPLALGVLTGCGGSPSGSPGEPSAAPSALAGAGAAQEIPADSGTMLAFSLERGVERQLPVTYCAGSGSVLTIVGREGDTQVDVRIIENELMRGGAPLEDSTETTYRFTGEESGRRYEELWESATNRTVIRDGDSTRIEGKMRGRRMYATSETTFSPPQAIDNGQTVGFSLEVRCSQ